MPAFSYLRQVKKPKKYLLDFEVDELTNSIKNIISLDSFKTDILPVSEKDFVKVTKKNDWKFNWKQEFKSADRSVYKLVIRDNVNIIQGLISLTPTHDNVYMHLIETAPFNFGNKKIYSGVAGNLVAFACKQSFHRGTDGYVSFRSKTQLIKHYEETLGAVHFGGHLMIINTQTALTLINKYFDS